MVVVLAVLVALLLDPHMVSADVLLIPADAVSVRRIDELPIGSLPLLSGWRFHTGHAEAWAARDFDDSGWTLLDTLETALAQATRERIGWTGEGWFRLRVSVSPALPVEDLGLVYGHYGALAIYLDGQLLHASGQVASGASKEEVFYVHGLKEVTPLPLTPDIEHVIALHYSNHKTVAMFDPPEEPGFSTALVHAPAWRSLAQRFVYARVQQQTLFVVPLAFGLFHLLLFFYHRQQRGHLYYALFALSAAVLIYAPLYLIFAHTLLDLILLPLVFKWSLLAVSMTGLLFLYTEFLGGPSRWFKWACVFGFGVGSFALVLPLAVIYYITTLFLVDVMRIVLFRLRRDTPGARVVRVGWFLFAGGCLLQVLIELEIIENPLGLDNFEFFPYIYGILMLVVSMSVYLARAVAQTNHDLAAQLQHVRDLSARAVEHEREVQSAKLSTLTHLVAGIVHELNSPVGAIRSARDTLSRALGRLRDSLPPGRALQAIDGANATIESATDRLGTVLSGFKAFSHLDEAEWQIAPIEAGLDSTLAIMESQLGSRISVQREYGGVPAIWCAPARLNQVFMHLLTNAIAAIDGSGTIRLSTWVEAEQVCIGIGDSGAGIPAEHLDGLFDIGFRRSARVKMGMGLVADSHTVGEHGGKMEVRSEVGAGTEVVVRLPLRLRE